MKTFVIADVHGHAELLQRLLARLPIDWGTDEVVLLGDLIDRGPASHTVLARVMALYAQYPQVTCLCGNHEDMLLQALQSEPAFQQWLAMDGGTTYATYCPPTRKLRWDLLVRSVPDAVQTFLAGLPCWYQNAHGHYAHAGARRDAHGQWVVDTRHTALWSRDLVFFREYDGPLLVVGHTPTQKIRKLVGEPSASENEHQAWERERLIGIDCDAGAGGPLCALELPTRHYYYEYPLRDT